MKKRFGSVATMISLFPGAALIQTATRSRPCMSFSYIANIFPTRHVGVPHASTSVDSGSALITLRSRVSGFGFAGMRYFRRTDSVAASHAARAIFAIAPSRCTAVPL